MKTSLTALFLFTAVFLKAQSNHQFNIHFDLDKFELTARAVAQLDSFMTASKNPVQVMLYGHCDSIAGDRYNDILSQKRVQSVEAYLISKGFDKNDIIEERGFGKRKPLNGNHTAWEMHLNRRVEVLVSEKEKAVLEESNAEEKTPEIKPAVSLTEKIQDTATKAGTNIILHNMNFYGGTHVILPQSLKVLLELLDVMKKNPTLEIAVEGHICCMDGNVDGYDIGTGTNNLSENRAREICSYLAHNGISQSRLQYKGFGHQRPLTPYPEKTEEERINNRRVEIKIIRR